ncbi:hypothetical protein HYC85_024439 [Camellia sinensis]|uniref:Uncharacterized protein n=1 Tax=Camellia sinensis TaxID=4442 RepID=A0A7J7G846_CAMSI|nr:hypothetical protein HYC85_024439 [Camellia sinensis]
MEKGMVALQMPCEQPLDYAHQNRPRLVPFDLLLTSKTHPPLVAIYLSPSRVDALFCKTY